MRRGQAATIDLLAAGIIVAATLIYLFTYTPPAPPRVCKLYLGDVLVDGSLADCIATPGCDVANFIGEKYGTEVYVQLYRVDGTLVGEWGDPSLVGGAVREIVALRNGTLLVLAVRC